jgi:hypothetical protein
MTDDVATQAKKRKAQELEAGNLRSYNEFGQTVQQEFGQTVNMDTGDTRREVFIEHLVKLGVITEEQYWDFEIEFHTRIEARLNEEWATLREALKKKGQPKLSVAKKPTVLLDQHGRPLV